jgi:membrane-bound metal-dependent hydrolase YbcI (DUF457 family)
MNLIRHMGMTFSDAGLGILVAVFVCALLDVEVTPVYLAIGLIFAYAPDCDWVLDRHFWKTGLVAAHAGNPYDHREGLHKPLLWALAISGWGILAPGPVPMIALIAVMCHFLHDTVGTGWGMPWFWPLTKRRFKFFSTKQNEMTMTPFLVTWAHAELPQYIKNYGRANWKDYYYGSWTSVAIFETIVMAVGFVVGIIALL